MHFSHERTFKPRGSGTKSGRRKFRARSSDRVSSQAVSQWKRIPAERVLDVERATGIRKEELRPDLYRSPLVEREGEGHFSRYAALRRRHFATAEEVADHVRALRDEWDRR